MQEFHQLVPLVLFGLSAVWFIVGRSRAVAVSGGYLPTPRSRPGYHGHYVFLLTLIAGIGLYLLCLAIGSWCMTTTLTDMVRELDPEFPPIKVALAVSDVRAIAASEISSRTDAVRTEVAGMLASLNTVYLGALLIIPLCGSGFAGQFGIWKIHPDRRARNGSETILRGVLLACALIAVLTTIGIVLSLIFETLSFFNKIGWRLDKFLFGLE